MQLFDTHCHIHSDDYGLPVRDVLINARKSGVSTFLCVGTDAADSQRAVNFSAQNDDCYAAVGIHPHEAKHQTSQLPVISSLLASPKVVAIGEVGLDYFYEHSPRSAQERMLHAHFEWALQYNLPMVFHVREAFQDFWKIYDSYYNADGHVPAVVHSFTADIATLDNILARNLYVGVNGIATFTKNDWQIEALKAIPLESLMLETDAPFLTPAPLRGTINEPKHLCLTAEFMSKLLSVPLATLSAQTTTNARSLFRIN